MDSFDTISNTFNGSVTDTLPFFPSPSSGLILRSITSSTAPRPPCNRHYYATEVPPFGFWRYFEFRCWIEGLFKFPAWTAAFYSLKRASVHRHQQWHNSAPECVIHLWNIHSPHSLFPCPGISPALLGLISNIFSSLISHYKGLSCICTCGTILSHISQKKPLVVTEEIAIRGCSSSLSEGEEECQPFPWMVSMLLLPKTKNHPFVKIIT